MSFGLIALILAGLGAGWLLVRIAKGDEGETRNVTLFKIIVWFGLAAALMAAKLWPLAFMVLLAAAAVTGIEIWRGKQVAEDEKMTAKPAPLQKAMSEDEALSILGLPAGAGAEAIKAAHKKLIAQIHPDKGGTDYLAAKINEARDYLLRALE